MMYKLLNGMQVEIEGCPRSGIEALEWREAAGVGAATTNTTVIPSGPLDPAVCRDVDGLRECLDENADIYGVWASDAVRAGRLAACVLPLDVARVLAAHAGGSLGPEERAWAIKRYLDTGRQIVRAAAQVVMLGDPGDTELPDDMGTWRRVRFPRHDDLPGLHPEAFRSMPAAWDRIAAHVAQVKADKREAAARDKARREEAQAVRDAAREALDAGLDKLLRRDVLDAHDLPRYEAGFMHEDDQLGALRGWALSRGRFAGAARYERLHSNSVTHDDDCCGYAASVEFETEREDVTLDREPFAVLLRIQADAEHEQAERAAAAESCGLAIRYEVEPRVHVARCEECGAETRRPSARVLVTLSPADAPNTVSEAFGREYALDGKLLA